MATRKFHWQHAGEGKKHEKLLSIGYRISLASMANELAIEAKKDSAIKILDLCLKYFGNDKLAFDYFALKIMEACYKLKLYDKGNQIAKTIVYNFNHDITVLDDDVVRQKSPKYEKLVDDVRDLMNLYYQDVSIIEGSK